MGQCLARRERVIGAGHQEAVLYDDQPLLVADRIVFLQLPLLRDQPLGNAGDGERFDLRRDGGVPQSVVPPAGHVLDIDALDFLWKVLEPVFGGAVYLVLDARRLRQVILHQLDDGLRESLADDGAQVIVHRRNRLVELIGEMDVDDQLEVVLAFEDGLRVLHEHGEEILMRPQIELPVLPLVLQLGELDPIQPLVRLQKEVGRLRFLQFAYREGGTRRAEHLDDRPFTLVFLLLVMTNLRAHILFCYFVTAPENHRISGK